MQLAPNQVLLLFLQVGGPLLVGVGAALLFQVWLHLIRSQGARLTCGFEERGRGGQSACCPAISVIFVFRISYFPPEG